MPRRLRIHVPGAFYHVTLRGNHREPIFRSRADRALLNAIVARSLRTHLARLHAYCWMKNHLHFFLQVGEVPLGTVMRDIASNYARAYQAKLETTGHLFERRYYAKIVDVDAYLFAVLRYIHLNPVVDGLARSAGDYEWSYRRFMDEPSVERDDALFADGSGDVLGSDEFSSRLFNKPSKTVCMGMSLEQLLVDACGMFNITEARLRSNLRTEPVVQARAWVAMKAVKGGSASLSEVARVLGRDRATLRYAIRRHSEALKKAE